MLHQHETIVHGDRVASKATSGMIDREIVDCLASLLRISWHYSWMGSCSNKSDCHQQKVRLIHAVRLRDQNFALCVRMENGRLSWRGGIFRFQSFLVRPPQLLFHLVDPLCRF